MTISNTALAIGCLLVGTACISDADPVLYLSLERALPDTTSAQQLTLSGEVTRVPARQGLITVVRVTGGAIPAVDTASLHGLFTVNVALLVDSDNNLEITASDNTGAQTVGPYTRTVVQQSAPVSQSNQRNP